MLETGEFEKVGGSRTLQADVRLLSATNADLAAEVEKGRFRQDLRFRLNTIELHLPPLRERPEDIRPLALAALQRHAQRYRKDLAGFEPSALQSLERHPWPGNVRELDHAVERAVLITGGNRIGSADLLLGGPASPSLEELSLEELQALVIRKALARHGSATAAAEALGLSRSALYRRLQKLGIGG